MWRWWVFYLEASSFSCLHVSTSFLGLQPYGLGGLSLVSRGSVCSSGSPDSSNRSPSSISLIGLSWLCSAWSDEQFGLATLRVESIWRSSFFSLPPPSIIIIIIIYHIIKVIIIIICWDYKWYYCLLVHYTKIVNLYGNQLFNYCRQTFTKKLILYKILFKSYYIIYHIIKVVTHLVIVPIGCPLALYYIFQYFLLMWCGTL